MVKGVYSKMIRNLQLYVGYQDIQYIHALLMDPEFGFMENIMHQMVGKLSKMLNMSKRKNDIPTLTESMKGPYKAEFMHAINQEIKELEKPGTNTIYSRKSVNGAHTLPNTWDFKVKRFPDGRLRNFKARFFARGDR